MKKIVITLSLTFGCSDRSIVVQTPGGTVTATTSGPNGVEVTVHVDAPRQAIVPVLLVPVPVVYPHVVHALAEKP